jgi:hypothetical protein
MRLTCAGNFWSPRLKKTAAGLHGDADGWEGLVLVSACDLSNGLLC